MTNIKFKAILGISGLLVFSAIILCVVSCGKKEYKPVKIVIGEDGSCSVNSKALNEYELTTYLIREMNEKGRDFPVIFISDKSTLYKHVEPVLFVVCVAGTNKFGFQLTGKTKVEVLDDYYGIGCRKQESLINLFLIDNLVQLNKKELTFAQIKTLLDKKPDKTHGYLVSITPDRDNTFGALYHLIEACNASRYGKYPRLRMFEKVRLRIEKAR